MASLSSGALLVPIDSIFIAETETLYIGHPLPPTIDPFDGSFYISDTFGKRVLRIDRSGHVVHVIGGPGGGPAEFGFNGLVFVLDDSTVVVVDERVQQLKYFNRSDATYRGARPFYPNGEAGGGTSVPVRAGDFLWFASVGSTERAALARWDLGSDSISWLGRMPLDYETSRDEGSPSYANHMTLGALAATPSYLVRGWMPKNELGIYNQSGDLIGFVDVPVRRRRGVPRDIRHRYDVAGMQLRERMTVHSRLRQVHSLTDGSIVTIHNDQEIVSMDGPLPVISATPWLSVLSPDLERACVDTEVPAFREVVPAAAVRGDTLFVFDRRIVQETQLETWIVKYLIDTSACEWLPTRRLGADG